MAKLPNPPKSKRLTKKVGLECLAILNEIDRVFFDSRILEMPCLCDRMREVTRTEDPDKWVREMHDRIIDARANLWAWKDEEARKVRKQKASRQRKRGHYVITRVAPDGVTRLFLTKFAPVSDGHLVIIEDAGWAAIKDAAVEFPSYDYARQIMGGIVAGEKSDSKFGKMWAELKHGTTPRRRRSNVEREKGRSDLRGKPGARPSGAGRGTYEPRPVPLEGQGQDIPCR